jgi:hypothetical protein
MELSLYQLEMPSLFEINLTSFREFEGWSGPKTELIVASYTLLSQEYTRFGLVYSMSFCFIE